MPHKIPRCQVVPLPGDQVAFRVDGTERLRWHFGGQYPRPFFYPLTGPSGAELTRMGHPGDYSHDHHRSVWFAHHKVMGLDFWSDRTTTRIRQKRWLAYKDDDRECAMAALLGWHDGHNAELMEQELVAAVQPGSDGEILVELQSTFRPTGKELTLEKSNFGLLAVRMAKDLSAHFGGGKITNNEGQEDEENVFNQPARWVDYSGPVIADAVEGITYIDHPTNPGQPTRWHVREDGWMGASLCRDSEVTFTQENPLTVRYLLYVHAGPSRPLLANRVAADFSRTGPYLVKRVRVPHRSYLIERGPQTPSER
ncbi:MAG: PmoA family protein [Planctomycetales bacterium]